MFKGDNMAKKARQDTKGQGAQEKKITRREALKRAGMIGLGILGSATILSWIVKSKMAHAAHDHIKVKKTGTFEDIELKEAEDMLNNTKNFRWTFTTNMAFKFWPTKNWIVRLNSRTKDFDVEVYTHNKKVVAGGMTIGGKMDDGYILDIPISATDKMGGPAVFLAAGKDALHFVYYDKVEGSTPGGPGYKTVEVKFPDFEFKKVHLGVNLDKNGDLSALIVPADQVKAAGGKLKIGKGAKCLGVVIETKTSDVYTGRYKVV